MKAAQPLIQFHQEGVSLRLHDRRKLRRFLVHLSGKEGAQVGALNFIFCSDAYLLEINRSHLHHDTYTDIITFPYSEPGQPIESDIYISVERVRENAAQFKVSFSSELHRVMFHGLLHLCGYKDKTPAQITKMREREDFWLAAYACFT